MDKQLYTLRTHPYTSVHIRTDRFVCKGVSAPATAP